ncbi:hypothetical protein GGR50DRAFT_693471 [Xylaria sp. CBS 124048]|nr:hypothetical protein GGR50DRAFT_693471 [Xylaria sp. CBS 124048]
MLDANHHQHRLPPAFTIDCGSHDHSAGFSHQPKKRSSKSRATSELVANTPQKDAGVDEVRNWVLNVFRRRCHPEPEAALQEFHWKGTDLHSQRRYLALRLRFRREPYGYMIAHDIHDAVKESRKRTGREKGRVKRKAKKAVENKPIPEPAMTRREGRSISSSPLILLLDDPPRPDEANTTHGTETHPVKTGRPSQLKKSTTAKAMRDILGIFAKPSKKTKLPKHKKPSSSQQGQVPEDPFQDPPPAHKEAEKKEKKKAERGSRIWRKKNKTATGSTSEPLQDPFRDPVEPMRLVDADDFRVESARGSTDNPAAIVASPSHPRDGKTEQKHEVLEQEDMQQT